MTIRLPSGRRVTIGEDGILLHRAWKERFIPIGLIARVETKGPAIGDRDRGRALILHLKSGAIEQLDVGGEEESADDPTHHLDRLALHKLGRMKHRIETMMVLARGRAAANTAAPLPRRAGRPVAAWVEQLRHVPHDACYRQPAAPPADTLWRMVEDTTTEPASRAAAAVALGPLLNRRGRTRLAALATSTAAPLLSRAFEAVARKDDRKLTAALDALAPDSELTQ